MSARDFTKTLHVSSQTKKEGNARNDSTIAERVSKVDFALSNEIRTREFDWLGGVQAMAMAWDGCQPWGEDSSVSINATVTHESTWMPTTQYPFMNLA